MWIGKPRPDLLSQKEEDTTVVVMFRQGEAERLRVILNGDQRQKLDPKTPLKFAPFRNKLDQGLELLGVRLKQQG